MEQKSYIPSMTYRYEDTDEWISKALPVQRNAMKYVTFDQLMIVWDLKSKSAVSHRLIHLISVGKVERFKIGARYHYHFIDEGES